MDDDVVGYIVILIVIFGLGSTVITILSFISLLFLGLFILLVPLIIFGYIKSRNKRRCPSCYVIMVKLEKEDKTVYQCPECSKIFRDIKKEPKRKIEKQDYKNFEWLKHQYFDLEKSLQEIAIEQHVSMITIQKWVEKLENKLRGN
ncbi:MAG: hypothetical protein ACFE9S_19025, partial [Candidatus Hermodarchaeota archaeon]